VPDDRQDIAVSHEFLGYLGGEPLIRRNIERLIEMAEAIEPA